MSLAPLELSARALLWSGSLSSPFGSPLPSPVVYLPHSRRLSLQLFNGERQSLAALAEIGDVEGLKAALKDDADSVNDTDEVRRYIIQHNLSADFLYTVP